MVRILAPAALVAWMLACNVASAATVMSSWRPPPGGDPAPASIDELTVTAAPGEQNRLGLIVDTSLVLRDTAGLQTSAPCVALDTETVRCPLGRTKLRIFLGDGDDTLTAPFLPELEADGGAGDDVLSAIGAKLLGGPGDDRLTGDWVVGGPGNDALQATHFDYSDHTAGVRVDVGRGVAVAPGERDELQTGDHVWVTGGAGDDVIRAGDRGSYTTIEAGAGDDVIDGGPHYDGISGGAGDDVIRGHGAFDALDGEGGNDRIEGGAGADRLSGGSGDDVLDGGSGRDRVEGDSGVDRILARDGERDDLECGRHQLQGDRAVIDAVDDAYACTHVDRAGPKRLEILALIRVQPWELLIACPRAATRAACTGRLRLGKLRRLLKVAPGQRVRLPIPRHESDTQAYRLDLRDGRVVRGSVAEVKR